MQPSDDLKKIPVQGVNHITLMGTDRKDTLGFWHGVLGMALVLDQRNPKKPYQSQLFFDPGDGRLITVFTDEGRTSPPGLPPTQPGMLHHLALSVSAVVFEQIEARLRARGMTHSPTKDRGFLKALYVKDPLGLTIELCCYTFEPPQGSSHSDVLLEANRIQLERRDPSLTSSHLADAIERLIARNRPQLPRT